ncbi:sensor histidine kinase [Sphingobium sp.]|uniref:sensor histidine kinase n=1 Tax=Sphingobium sp. TaxID=1912891 RepID=UPI003B3A6136
MSATAAAHAPHATAEMNHRIANNLTLLASMIELDGRAVIDPDAISVLETARRRIHAIANVHRRLYMINKTDRLNLGEFLGDLAEDFRNVCESGAHDRHLIFQANSVWVSAEEAVVVGILVAELVSNACKHAYHVGEPGDIRILLSAAAPGEWTLMVEDDGHGFDPASAFARQGLGSRLIAAAVTRLSARYAWEDTRPGTRFTLWKCSGAMATVVAVDS